MAFLFLYMLTSVKERFPIAYPLSVFLLLVLGFHAFYIFFIGATAPGGKVYISWLQAFNFLDALRLSINKTAAFVLHLLGYTVTACTKELLQINFRSSVFLAYDCIGFGVMSVWVAFVIVDGGSFKKMILWLVFGLLALWVINVTRITLLILFNYNHWKHILPFDHHTNFNIVSYVFILLMVRIKTRNS